MSRRLGHLTSKCRTVIATKESSQKGCTSRDMIKHACSKCGLSESGPELSRSWTNCIFRDFLHFIRGRHVLPSCPPQAVNSVKDCGKQVAVGKGAGWREAETRISSCRSHLGQLIIPLTSGSPQINRKNNKNKLANSDGRLRTAIQKMIKSMGGIYSNPPEQQEPYGSH